MIFTDESLTPVTGNSIVVQVCDKRGDSAATSLNQLLFQAMGAETVTVTAMVNGQESFIEVKIIVLRSSCFSKMSINYLINFALKVVYNCKLCLFHSFKTILKPFLILAVLEFSNFYSFLK